MNKKVDYFHKSVVTTPNVYTVFYGTAQKKKNFTIRVKTTRVISLKI